MPFDALSRINCATFDVSVNQLRAMEPPGSVQDSGAAKSEIGAEIHSSVDAAFDANEAAAASAAAASSAAAAAAAAAETCGVVGAVEGSQQNDSTGDLLPPVAKRKDLYEGDMQVNNEPRQTLAEPLELTASTSKVEQRSKPVPLPESLKNPRKSLPLLPRISQYERHPILQVRSGTGLSEFEIFLLEKELFKRRTSAGGCSGQWSEAESCAEDSVDPGSKDNSSRGQRLIPRSAHYEPHPLLKKSVSGVCELELYLMEKQAEVERRCHGDPDEETTITDGGGGGERFVCKSVRQSKLEPRSDQWEKHALLEVKDETGLSEMEKLFLDAEEQQEKRRVNERHESHPPPPVSPSSPSQLHQQPSPSTDQSKALQSSKEATGIVPNAQAHPQSHPHPQKRVRFERRSVEADDSGIDANQIDCSHRLTPIDRNDDGRDAKRRSDNNDNNDERTTMIPPERRTDEKKTKRSSSSCRTSTSSSSSSSSSIKKSCCMS